MKVFGLVCLFAISTTYGLPTSSRSQPNDCEKECITGVLQYGHELSILKNPDLATYFSKLDEVCEVITTAKLCVQNCGASNNPFALESLNIVCQPDVTEKVNIFKQCLQYVDHSVHETCLKECNHGEDIVDETDVTRKMNPVMEKANGDCSTFKCMARCNVEIIGKECGKNVGEELQALLQQVLDSQRKDLVNRNLVEIMAKSSPPECNYLYDPSVLFGGNKAEESAPTPAAPVNPEEDAKSLFAQAQLQLLLKQLELADKQEHLIERENAKLDMEMSLIAHKAHQREQRFHAQAGLPTFMPKEFIHAEPMPMESIQEQPQEPEKHQPTEAVRFVMEEPHHPMPEEPSHPEQPHHPEEPHHSEPQMQMVPIEGFPMPMEAMPRFY